MKLKETTAVNYVLVGHNVVCSDTRGSLYLMDWKGEPSVLIDGSILIKRSTLMSLLQKNKYKKSSRYITEVEVQSGNKN